MYSENPKDYYVVTGYVNVLSEMKQDTLIVSILGKYLQNSSDWRLNCRYAESLTRLGKNTEADKAWLIAKKIKEQVTYKEIIFSQASVQQFEKAVGTIKEARKIFDDPGFNMDGMVDYSIALNDPKRLYEEIISQYREYRQDYNIQKYIQLGIIRMPEFKEYFKKAIYSEPSYIKSIGEDRMSYLSILGWFHSLIGENDLALERYKEYDNLIDINRRQRVFDFAETLSKDKNYADAIKAYNYVITEEKVNDLVLLRALYGYNFTLENIAESGTEISREEYVKIIQGYKEIENKYSIEKMVVQQAVLREGIIQFEKLGNTAEAVSCMNKIITKAPNSILTFTAANELGDIYIGCDSLDKAHSYFSEVFEKGKNIRGAEDAADYAHYELAEIEYFKGNIDTAFAMFKEIADNYSENSSNDATTKILFLENNKEQLKAVQTYALAEKFVRQKRFDEAAAAFKESMQYGGEDLQESALLETADVYKIAKNPTMRDQVLQEFVQKFPDSDRMDEVLYNAGECQFDLNEGTQAVETLTSMLVKFPRSIYAEKARDLIRTIRKTLNGNA